MLPARLLAGDRLVAATRVAAGGSLAVHVSGAKANALVAAAGQQMPGLGRLAVTHVGCSFLLTAPPTFHRLTALTSLRWVEAAKRGGGACAACCGRTVVRALSTRHIITHSTYDAEMPGSALQYKLRMRAGARRAPSFHNRDSPSSSLPPPSAPQPAPHPAAA